jgi:hypothetical protein
MIKTNKGKVTIKGYGGELLSDFTVIAKSVGDAMMKCGIQKEFVVAELKKCVGRAFMTDEELVKALADEVREMVNDIFGEESEEEERE